MYIVFAPVKTYSGIQDRVVLATDDKEAAIKYATATRDQLNRRNWKAWAKRVKIVLPKTPKALVEMADLILVRAHELDLASNGNSFEAQTLFEKAQTLQIRADELANPESYAA